MDRLHPKVLFLVWLSACACLSSAQSREIDFISDTQQPMGIEKLIRHQNHNIKATSLLLADILKQRPIAVYMLGDVVAIASNEQEWDTVDKFIDSCRMIDVPVHGLLGNHDLMWSRQKGEENFQHRFPDHVNTGYLSITDSIAVIMLNSNFTKLSAVEIDRQQHWYTATLDSLNNSPSIKTIIVSCHHSPYSNSKVVGSSTPVQRHFVPAFLQSAKCSLFISGHAHAFEHFKRSGKNFLVIGGGGGLHQPLDTSARRIPDVAFGYKPMFHYLSLQRIGDHLLLTSHFLKPDFSGIGKGYTLELLCVQKP
jgi:hypothetical protein